METTTETLATSVSRSLSLLTWNLNAPWRHLESV
jgi:hypothetical protein